MFVSSQLFLFFVRPSLSISFLFFFNDTATTEIYTLSLHDALPIYVGFVPRVDTRSIGASLVRTWRQASGWFTQILAGTTYGRTWDHAGDLTDESVGLFVNYFGPLQSVVAFSPGHARVRFSGTLFDLNAAEV